MKQSKKINALVKLIGIISIIVGVYLAIIQSNFLEYFFPIVIGASLLAASFQSDEFKSCTSNSK